MFCLPSLLSCSSVHDNDTFLVSVEQANIQMLPNFLNSQTVARKKFSFSHDLEHQKRLIKSFVPSLLWRAGSRRRSYDEKLLPQGASDGAHKSLCTTICLQCFSATENKNVGDFFSTGA
jgi:hypothetical protein